MTKYANLLPLLFAFGPTVLKGSVLSVSLSNTVEVIDGSRVEIRCRTDGIRNYYKWYTSTQMTLTAPDYVLSICFEHTCYPSFLKEKYKFTYSGTDLVVNIPKVGTADEKYWICADGSDSSDSQSLFLYVKVPVTSVSMDEPSSLEVNVNKSRNISCITSYGRPGADIKFYIEINGNSVEILQNVYTTFNENDSGVTLGTLVYIATRSDDGAKIYCKANNTITQIQVIAPNPVTVHVIEPPSSPPDIKGFTNGSTYTLTENNTLQLTCSIKGGRPRPSLSWRCNGGTVENENSGDETKVKVTWRAKRSKLEPCRCISYHPAVSTNQSVSVYIAVLYKPQVPTTFTHIHEIFSATTAGFQWTPGFDGESGEPSHPIALIGGAAGGGAAIVVIVVVVLVVIFFRRSSSFNDSQGDQNRGDLAEDDDEYRNISDLQGEQNRGDLAEDDDEYRNISGGQFNRGNETYYNIDRNPYEELRHTDNHNRQYGTLHSGDSDAGEAECRLPTDKTYENLRLSPIRKKTSSTI